MAGEWVVAIVDQKDYFSAYVKTAVSGTYFKHFNPAYIEKYRGMGCLEKVLKNDFFHDHETWCKSSKGIPSIAEEIYDPKQEVKNEGILPSCFETNNTQEETKMMNGQRSFVVLGKLDGADFGMIRHPYLHEETARERAEMFASQNPGQAFYVAEVYVKVTVPTSPKPEWEGLV